MQFKISKQFRQGTVLGVLTIVVLGAVLAHAETMTTSDGIQLKEISAPHPSYPKSAWQHSPDGHVTLTFDVTEDGLVENSCIVESTVSGKFELYALHVLKAHRYEHIDGPAQHIQGVRKRIEFSLDSGPTVPIKPKYPRRALESGTEGYVVVEFGVTEWGASRHLIVAEAEPTDFFEAAALDAANLFKFASQRYTEDDRILHKFTFSLDSKPLNLVIAEYPAEAKENQIEGHVIVEFDINNEGNVENAKAIYSDTSAFEPAAITAVSMFGFDPNKPAQGVLHKVDFNLNQDWQRLTRVEPEYPRQALLDYIEGYAIVRFELDETGSVDNASVEERNHEVSSMNLH